MREGRPDHRPRSDKRPTARSPDQILMIVEKRITIPQIQAVSALYHASRERESVVKLLHLDNQLQIDLIT